MSGRRGRAGASRGVTSGSGADAATEASVATDPSDAPNAPDASPGTVEALFDSPLEGSDVEAAEGAGGGSALRLAPAPSTEALAAPDAEPGAAGGTDDGGSPNGDDEAPPDESLPPDPFGPERLSSIIESVLFASDKPLNALQLAELIGLADLGPVRAALASIEAVWQPRGVQLQAVAGGYQFRTSAANAAWVQKMLAQKPVRLTRAQLETLAICAYRQPITRPEIDEIRGVDSAAAVKSLMDRSLVRILGKREEPGRPLLFGTTREFLDFFSLSDLRDLPTLREFHELTEEHRAQVAALEEKAPAGSVETVEEAMAAAARRPLERVTFEPPPEDAAELDEIDRLIATAGGERVVLDPSAPSTEEPVAPAPDRARK